LLERAIAIDPNDAGRYNNFGNILLAAERVDDAVAAYEKSLAIVPDQPDAHNNLGIIFRAQKRFHDAAQAFERALAIDPEHGESWNNYGNLHATAGDVQEAVKCYSKALTLSPGNPHAKQYLALAHVSLGELDKATRIYREWLEKEPNHPGVKHLLAACSGEGVPERASDEYVVQTFDSFSKSFDSRLAMLQYRAPQLVVEALERAVGAPAGRLAVLDVGCGTGLCGPLLRPHASRLVGVDLSPGMLGKARLRAVYDELVEAELTSFLQSRCNEFDVIVSADTFVYVGAVAAAFEGAARALRPGGVFVFTLEAADDDAEPAGFHLNPTGRYSHTRAYVERTLRATGFADAVIESETPRREFGQPVRGLLVTARVNGGTAGERPARSDDDRRDSSASA
jgi:predicted TPR repeat methyltransferase